MNRKQFIYRLHQVSRYGNGNGRRQRPVIINKANVNIFTVDKQQFDSLLRDFRCSSLPFV